VPTDVRRRIVVVRAAACLGRARGGAGHRGLYGDPAGRYLGSRAPGRPNTRPPVPTTEQPHRGGHHDEPDETFQVDLSNISNANLADGGAAGMIVDDDDPAPPVGRHARVTVGS